MFWGFSEFWNWVKSSISLHLSHTTLRFSTCPLVFGMLWMFLFHLPNLDVMQWARLPSLISLLKEEPWTWAAEGDLLWQRGDEIPDTWFCFLHAFVLLMKAIYFCVSLFGKSYWAMGSRAEIITWIRWQSSHCYVRVDFHGRGAAQLRFSAYSVGFSLQRSPQKNFSLVRMPATPII